MYWLVLTNQILSAFVLNGISFSHWLSQHYSQCKLLPHSQWWQPHVLPESTELKNYVLSGKSPWWHINPHYCHKGHLHFLPAPLQLLLDTRSHGCWAWKGLFLGWSLPGEGIEGVYSHSSLIHFSREALGMNVGWLWHQSNCYMSKF